MTKDGGPAITDRELLEKTMSTDEGVTIPMRTVNRLVRAGLVIKCFCSDGNYIETTGKGKQLLADRDKND